MSDQWEEWWRALRDAPNDWRLWLVFADWLEEQGEVETAGAWRQMAWGLQARLREESQGNGKARALGLHPQGWDTLYPFDMRWINDVVRK